MTMKSERFTALLLAGFSAYASAHTHHTGTTFLPENNRKIPANLKQDGGLTFNQFTRVIDKIEKHYAPIVKRQGGNLVIFRKWDNPTVNAGTYREETSTNWYVNLYGGFARHKSLSEDGFALVVCHEIGHHVGGAPKKEAEYGYPAWSTTEGQSDYYATLKCLRQIFLKEDNLSIVGRMEIPSIVREKCSESFPIKWEAAICMRSIVAGQGVADVMSDTLALPFASIDHEDTFVTAYTLNKHPAPQCRLDTYFRGAVCQVSSYRPVSQIDPARGTCDITTGFEIGTRPLCWYKP